MILRLLILFTLMPLFSYGQATILTGRVWDPVDGHPVEEARVRLYLGTALGELNTVTNEEGRFIFTYDQLMYNVDYAIIIQKEGYHRLNGAVRLNYGDGPDRQFNLYKTRNPEPELTVREQSAGPSLLGAPTNNLIFLIDVSGSMAEQSRLDNLKESLLFLVGLYRPEDQISIITYASNVEVLLEGGRISKMDEINQIIRQLQPTGRTEGVAGLVRAYDIAGNLYLRGGNNKVVLATDGIFGEDKKSRKLVEEVIIRGRSQDVSLSVFSFGDEAASVSERLESWSALGRGNHTHINTLGEAKEQIVKEARGE